VAHEEIRSEQVFKRPAAPFSLATRTTGGTLLHVSGQVAQGLDGDTVGRGDIERQTIQVLENIKALVEAAGGGGAHRCRADRRVPDHPGAPPHRPERAAPVLPGTVPCVDSGRRCGAGTPGLVG
jgi:enamine deaminase RidA (YjgF/YER057c/UK114 family)